jgi:hypothetical protein
MGVVDALELQSLTAMMEKMFGDNVISCLKDKYDNGIRGFLESTSAVTQCKNTIKNFTDIDERTGKKHACWICGFDIVPGDESLKPECEHIFPIAQAVVFIGLYREEDVEYLRGRNPDENVNKIKKAWVDRIKPEYGWAHRVCNQVKSDTHFIRLNPSGDSVGTSRWMVDNAQIVIFLKDILREKKYGDGGRKIQALLAKAGYTEKAWLTERTTDIARRCTEVLSVIPPVNENLALLAAMATLQYDIERSGCVSEDVPKTIPSVQEAPPLQVTNDYASGVYASFLDYAMNQVRPVLTGFVSEKIPGVRTSPEDRMNRASAILLILNLDYTAKNELYNQIGAKFAGLNDKSMPEVVLLNELVTLGVYSALVGKLTQIQSMYPGSALIKEKIKTMTATINGIREVRPRYGGSRRPLYSRSKTSSSAI